MELQKVDKPITIIYLHQIKLLKVYIKYPPTLTKETISTLRKKANSEDGTVTINIEKFCDFSFQISPSLITHINKVQMVFLSSENTIKSLMQFPAELKNHIIIEQLPEISATQVLLTANGNLTGKNLFLQEIKCKCGATLFQYDLANVKEDSPNLLLFDINIKRIEDNINEMFSCFEDMCLTQNHYKISIEKIKKRINLDNRFFWINVNSFEKGKEITNAVQREDKKLLCDKCKKIIGSTDKETIPNIFYYKFSLVDTLCTVYNSDKFFSYTLNIWEERIFNFYLDALLLKYVGENCVSLSFYVKISETQCNLISFKFLPNYFTRIKCDYYDKCVKDVNIILFIEIIMLTKDTSSIIEEDNVIEIGLKEFSTLSLALNNNREKYKDEIESFGMNNKLFYFINLSQYM